MIAQHCRATIVATIPSAWDPARADQLAQLETLMRRVNGLDVRLHSNAGDQHVVLLDSNGDVRWSHDGPMSHASVDALALALESLAPAEEEGDRLAPSRREFVLTALAAAFLLSLKPAKAGAERVQSAMVALNPVEAIPPAATVQLNVNGKGLSLNLEPRVTLLDALREYAGLTGTKKGCDHGQCGACTVHIDGRRQLSCMTFAVMHQNAKITTVEGLANGDSLHPMQAAFIKHDGFQCGYCTPGQLMSATALLKEPCGSGDADVKECMSGNICRCGAYPGIIAAIQEVRTAGRS